MQSQALSPAALSSLLQGATVSSAFASGVTGASVSPQQDREAELQTHPFYHIPRIDPDDVKAVISWERVRQGCNSHETVNAIRHLLKKKVLQKHEAWVLTFETSRLLHFAKHRMDKYLGLLVPSRAADIAATMLLVLDLLFAAGTALGPRSGMKRWWPALMNTIPRNEYNGRQTTTRQQKSVENLDLIQQILKTIEVYRKGQRPPAAALVPLKQRFICTHPTKKFKRDTWKFWREDDESWRKSK